jgi:hypothetical protein
MNLRDGSMQTFTAADGLADVYISRILSDQMGGVWITHKKGLTRVNTTTGVVKNYSVREGFQGYEFLDGAGFRDPVSGILYFGGVEGYVAFRRTRSWTILTPGCGLHRPANLEQDGQPWSGSEWPGAASPARYADAEDRPDLSGQGFSIEFAGLHYSCPEKNMYAYMLEATMRIGFIPMLPVGQQFIRTCPRVPIPLKCFRPTVTGSGVRNLLC